MSWLIWKEFRLNWQILVLGAFLLIAPYAGPVFVYLAYAWQERTVSFLELLDGVHVASVMCSALTLALLGGNSIASERADRSAEFLAYQPVSRGKILVSKLVLPLVTTLIVWGLNFVVLLLLLGRDKGVPIELLGYVPFLIAACCAFSVAWGMSAMQNSPTYAVAIGIAAPIVVIWLIGLVNWLTDFAFSNWQVVTAYVVITVSLAISSFVGGTWYYLWRVEP